jgi:hypothetical protein
VLQEHINQLASWLDLVHVETAQKRCGELLNGLRPKDMETNQVRAGSLDRACYHEATHAVAAHILGLKVLKITARSDGNGEAHHQVNCTDAYEKFASIVAGLAAPAFELFAGAGAERQFALAHSYDILDARLRIDEFQRMASAWEVTTLTFAQVACCLVASNRDAIARTAFVLRELGELPGAVIEALCESAQ